MANLTNHAILATIYLVAAGWSPIMDCDETFNYWEPLHFLLYGTGLQTWEYAPPFGLRSYFYLLLHLPIVGLVKVGRSKDDRLFFGLLKYEYFQHYFCLLRYNA
jgi:alpha-1,2-mannosyltransferase